jgi:tetratricopeptide (TPR) repeat protein
VGFVVAERVLYTPSMGFTLMLAVILVLALRCYPRITITLFVLLLAIHSARVIQRNYDWETDLRLWASALEVCPRSAKVRYTYAEHLLNNERYEEAIPHLKVALEIDPEEVKNYLWLAKAEWKLNRKNEALEAATQAFVLQPYMPQVVVFLREILSGIPQFKHFSGSNDPFLVDATTYKYYPSRILRFLLSVGEYLKNPRLTQIALQIVPQLVARERDIYN